VSKPWQAYALHILDAIGRIRLIRARGDLTQDQVLYDAALRNLQTLSEATQQLPDSLKAQHPAVPWREISGFRNILVHNYLGHIDAATVAAVVDNHLDALAHAVSAMLHSA
jgi:uncharacterized protein with HEPN domain